MKKKALRKEFYMEIKKSFNRFLSIFLIVALGVAFFPAFERQAPICVCLRILFIRKAD